MSYNGKTNWQDSEIVHSQDMNRIEQGITDLDTGKQDLTKNLGSKTSIVDADVMPIADSAAQNAGKKVTFSVIKSTLKTYFDNLYKTSILKLTGYSKASSISDIAATDTVNQAFGKVAKTLEDKAKTDLSNVPNQTFKDKAASSGVVGEVAQELNEHKAKTASHVKPARIVIGTTAAGWTAKDCHYLCDGIDDQAEINAAIQALPANGGEIVILDGTYNITAKINVNKDNVSIKGNGNATILKRMWDGSSAEGVITLTSVEGCKVQNLQIDGNKANYSSARNYGIYLYSSSSDNTITGNTCNNSYSGIYLSSSSDNTITGNTCNNNNDSGIYLSSSSSDNTITGNTCNNNSYGITLYNSSNNTVTGNTCNNNDYGIYLYGSSNNNTVTGNTCNNNSRGINLSNSSNNTVTGNACNNNNYYGIYLTSSSNNTVTGNTCNNNSSYGIYLHSSCNYNCIVGNVLVDNGTAYSSGGGTGNVEANNVKK